MLQLIIQGRGGQGAQKAGEILAEAFSREGKHIQAYATYGGARRGTPVSAFLRANDRPIRMRCDIDNPDVIICFDASLLTDALLSKAGENTMLLINSANSPDHFASLGNFKIITVDAINIAQTNQLGRIVNTTLVGAFAGLINEPKIDGLIEVVKEKVQPRLNRIFKLACRGFI